MTQSGSTVLNADALETNRAGKLTDAQRKGFRGLDRAIRKNELSLAVICAIIGALLLTSNGGPASEQWLHPVGGIGFGVVAVVLLVRALFLGDSLSSDLRSGHVETVEGAIGKNSYTSHSGKYSSTSYYLEVAGKRFEVAYLTYEAAPEAGWVRLYVLPRSHKVVNMERLPDKAVPEGLMESPTAALGLVKTMFTAHDSIQRNEARAEAAAMENTFKAEQARAATPPPADQRDPRPLAQAIVGTWHVGPTSVSFMPDGTVVATMFGGRQQNGRWSIGPDGKLHANAFGRDQIADAWVAGNVLTISEDGQGMALQRAAS
jgi:hypothetical protein